MRALVLIGMVMLGGCAEAADTVWTELEPGLDVARFDSRGRTVVPDGGLVIVRVDPAVHGLTVLSQSRLDGDRERNVRQWGEDFELAAVINAGMYQADRSTHVGFLQVDGEVLNRFANDYLSAAAFDPVDPGDPAFRIFDLDVTPLAEVRRRYGTVLQNLRLIKRGRENRWEPAPDRWREAALGEDGAGRMLLVYCTTAWSMQEFNEILLDLPVGLQCAQHLEGGLKARLWLADDPASAVAGASAGPPLPNVLGVARLEALSSSPRN